MPKTIKKFLALGLFILAALTSFRAFAIEYSGFGGKPAYPRPDNPRTESIFVYTINPGESKEDGILVANNTKELKTFLVYSTDSLVSTGGAFGCKQFSDEKNDVGSWINLRKDEITLDPYTSAVIDFTVQAPDSADVGEHNGCLIVQEKKSEEQLANGMSLSVRTGLRIIATIPGEIIKNLEIIGLSIKHNNDKSITLSPKLKNNGNVSLDIDLKVITRSIFGFKLTEQGGNYPILRGEEGEWNFDLGQPFWGGLYASTLSAKYNKNLNSEVGQINNQNLETIKSKTIWFWAWPTLFGLIAEILIFGVLIALFFVLKIGRNQKKWVKQTWVEFEVGKNQTIESISKKFNVSWELLVKVNKIRPPYILYFGQKIKVPNDIDFEKKLINKNKKEKIKKPIKKVKNKI